MSRYALFPKRHRMMTCRRVGEVLQAYLDHEVDDVTAQRIAHHLEDCRRCGMELEVYAEIKRSLTDRAGGVDERAVERLRSFGRLLAAGTEAPADPHGQAPEG